MQYRLDLDRAIDRVKEIIALDYSAMTPTEKLSLIGEFYEINRQFKVVH